MHVIIRLHGLGWGQSAEASEKDYEKLVGEIGAFIATREYFVSGGKTVGIQIEEEEPTVRGVLIRKDYGKDPTPEDVSNQIGTWGRYRK